MFTHIYFLPLFLILSGLGFTQSQNRPEALADFDCNDDTIYKNIISSPLTLSNNTVWKGKIYVAPYTIVTVDGVTLDLTSVDIVFGLCSGIDFINGAAIRANEAVFRPCDPIKSWRGLRFTSGSGGFINESIFKNAIIAVDLTGNNQGPNTSTRITNNLFINNYYGVYCINNTIEHGISGNTFMVNDAMVDFQAGACPSPINTTPLYGILAHQTKFTRQVSQNDFIDVTRGQTGKVFTGFFGNQVTGVWSENRFTNVDRAISLINSANFRFHNNRIETNFGFPSNPSQIWVNGSTGVTLGNNAFLNPRGSVTSSEAISVLSSDYVTVLSNRIEGFRVAIQFNDSRYCNVSENSVYKSDHGIRIFNGQNIYVGCNRIELFRGFGIFYIQSSSGDKEIQFQSNCIWNTSHALLLFSPFNQNAKMPLIQNNYFYNYSRYGIRNFWFSGDIGSGLTNASEAGRNTFVSNNIPNGALDISSNRAIVAAGNFGISSVSTLVTPIGTNLYNSTSACGNQIGTVSSVLMPGDPCSTTFTGPQILKEQFFDGLKTMPRNDRFRKALGLLAENPDFVAPLLDAVKQWDDFGEEYTLWFQYFAGFFNNEPVNPGVIRQLTALNPGRRSGEISSGNPTLDALYKAMEKAPRRRRDTRSLRFLRNLILFQNSLRGEVPANPFPNIESIDEMIEQYTKEN